MRIGLQTAPAAKCPAATQANASFVTGCATVGMTAEVAALGTSNRRIVPGVGLFFGNYNRDLRIMITGEDYCWQFRIVFSLAFFHSFLQVPQLFSAATTDPRP